MLRSNGRRGRGGGRVSKIVERYTLLAAWGVTCVIFGILRPNTFLTTSNFTTIFGSQAILVVLTLALLVPLTAGAGRSGGWRIFWRSR